MPYNSNRVERISEEVIHLFTQKGLTLGTAESLTAGMIAASAACVSGASAVLMGGVVSYDSRVKHEVLGVERSIIDTVGVVSEACARQMAEGARNVLKTDIAVSATGIAGPTGGTTDKPVGTVWIAWATPDGTSTECFHFGVAREREQITQRAVTTALVKLIQSIISKH